MNAELSILIDDTPPQKVVLGPLFSVGRGASNDLVLKDSRASRTHAVIRLQSDQVYYLVDLGSANGTLLNGRRVTIPLALKSGDTVQIANCKMQFEVPQMAEGAQKNQENEMRTELAAFTTDTISILVVDIRNYTRLSENIPAEELSRLVGSWFRDVDQIIQQNGGSIDKFIGDAVMAVWQSAKTEGDKTHILGPLKSSRELVSLAGSYNKKLSAQFSGFGFAVGCGINTGKAILGNIGVDSRRDFTAIGDCVNVAFRLESLCRELDRTIVLSEEVQQGAAGEFEFEDMGPQRVKGKSQDLRVFALKT